VQEGYEGILLYQIWETLATVKGACGYSVVPNKEKPLAKQDIQSRVNLCKCM
jgi:hypothetical protein